MANNYIERHKSWQKYAEKEIKAGRKPTPFKDWQVSSVYFRGMPKQTYESKMEAAGMTGKGKSSKYKRNK